MSRAHAKDKGFGIEASPDRHLQYVPDRHLQHVSQPKPSFFCLISVCPIIGELADRQAPQAEVEAFLLQALAKLHTQVLNRPGLRIDLSVGTILPGD